VGVRERGAAVALAALPRLHLELTPSPSTPVCCANKTRWRAGDRNPEYRDADEPHSGGRNQQHSGLADDGGLKTRLL
jgi:hypothetical protein